MRFHCSSEVAKLKRENKIMPFITIKCPTCHKVAETQHTYKIGDKLVNSLKCGHLINSDQLKCSSSEQIRSLDGKSLYAFQNKGVKFIEESGARCLLSDEMGLGKTPQSIAACFLHEKIGRASCRERV